MKLPGKDKLDRKGFKAMLLVHKKDFFFKPLVIFSSTKFERSTSSLQSIYGAKSRVVFKIKLSIYMYTCLLTLDKRHKWTLNVSCCS